MVTTVTTLLAYCPSNLNNFWALELGVRGIRRVILGLTVLHEFTKHSIVLKQYYLFKTLVGKKGNNEISKR